jgi:hypothetical protein
MVCVRKPVDIIAHHHYHIQAVVSVFHHHRGITVPRILSIEMPRDRARILDPIHFTCRPIKTDLVASRPNNERNRTQDPISAGSEECNAVRCGMMV